MWKKCGRKIIWSDNAVFCAPWWCVVDEAGAATLNCHNSWEEFHVPFWLFSSQFTYNFGVFRQLKQFTYNFDDSSKHNSSLPI